MKTIRFGTTKRLGRTGVGSSPMAVEADQREASRLFWLHHLRLGFFVLMAQSATLVIYFAVSAGSHRTLLTGIAVASMVIAALGLTGLTAHASHQPWRETFSFAWSVSSGALLAVVVLLDGGYGSPLLLLIPVPVVFAGVAFSPRRVVITGLCALAEFAAATSGELSNRSADWGLLVWTSGIVAIIYLAASGATNRKRLEDREQAFARQLADLATIDGLTGCLNHRAFTERLDEEIGRAVRHEWPLTVLVVDVDDFKHVNDTYGHSAGDDVLVAVARALRDGLRTGDVVGRMGGDEFIVMLPHSTLAGGAARAVRAQGSLTECRRVPATLSIGIAELDPVEPDARHLLEQADQALYHVKNTGRCGIATGSHGESHRIAG